MKNFKAIIVQHKESCAALNAQRKEHVSPFSLSGDDYQIIDVGVIVAELQAYSNVGFSDKALELKARILKDLQEFNTEVQNLADEVDAHNEYITAQAGDLYTKLECELADVPEIFLTRKMEVRHSKLHPETCNTLANVYKSLGLTHVIREGQTDTIFYNPETQKSLHKDIVNEFNRLTVVPEPLLANFINSSQVFGYVTDLVKVIESKVV